MSLCDLVEYYEDLADEAERQNKEYNKTLEDKGV
jgi:hypothetical protein